MIFLAREFPKVMLQISGRVNNNYFLKISNSFLIYQLKTYFFVIFLHRQSEKLAWLTENTKFPLTYWALQAINNTGESSSPTNGQLHDWILTKRGDGVYPGPEDPNYTAHCSCSGVLWTVSSIGWINVPWYMTGILYTRSLSLSIIESLGQIILCYGGLSRPL